MTVPPASREMPWGLLKGQTLTQLLQSVQVTVLHSQFFITPQKPCNGRHSEAPRASARGTCGEAKRNSAEANPAFHPPQLGLLQRMGALRGTPRSPVAIRSRASARGILAKASEHHLGA
jgi:hypothetical protein